MSTAGLGARSERSTGGGVLDARGLLRVLCAVTWLVGCADEPEAAAEPPERSADAGEAAEPTVDSATVAPAAEGLRDATVRLPVDAAPLVADAHVEQTAADAAADKDAQPAQPRPSNLTVFLAGDSTVSTYADTPDTHDQAGWGQMLGALFSAGIKVDNRAIGGRTARRFLDEKRLDTLLGSAKAGDYVLVQFGTNDGNRSATYELDGKSYPYYADPETSFRATLKTYLEQVSARGAIAVLVTPPPRNSAYCTGGNSTVAYAVAMRELGKAEHVAVVDLNARALAHLMAICPAPAPEDFFLLRDDGSVDGTHFQEHGARVLAQLVSDELLALGVPLAAALK